MTGRENNRRKRHPLTAEEVADIIAFKKRKEHERLIRFKKTTQYKALNIINICCYFVYVELLICFFGPCIYDTYRIKEVEVSYGNRTNSSGTTIVSDLNLDIGGRKYLLIVNDFVEPPTAGTALSVGSDFLLGKELKAVIAGHPEKYRLFTASPVIFLCLLALSISCVAVMYNLNQNSYSLTSMTVLNLAVMGGVLLLR